MTDGIDYVPTNKFVLFGHHWASITGLSPMLGPAVAVIWGWGPAMAWVVLGALLAVGAPLGLLAVRTFQNGELSVEWLSAEIRSDALSYVYVFLSTEIAFVLFGLCLGLQADRRAGGDGRAQHVAGRHLHDAVLLDQTLRLRALAGPGRSEQDQPHRLRPRNLERLIRPSYWWASR